MTNPRPSARTWIGVLAALMLFSALAAPVALGKDTSISNPPTVANPDQVCTLGNGPTKWQDDVHPPQTIRVLRSKGPNTGHVETANFWEYVAVVMRAEYSTGADKPPLWMQVGAITVKQYGWYKAMFWGGGRVTTTDSTSGVTTTECYDVKDGTADQIYKPDQWNTDHTIHTIGNIPTAPIYKAMAQTWHMTMRKWVADNNVSRLFLSGYRSGKKLACGKDTTAFKIFQQSLRDCIDKNMTVEETLREYFEPMLLVDTREHDSLSDDSWWGDLPVLSASGGNTAWNVSPGKVDGFDSSVSGTFSVPFSSIVGYYSGNVDLPGANPTVTDKSTLADIVMVTNSSVFAARATGTGFASPVVTDFSGGAAKAVFGDFDGDLMMDVGLVRSNGDGTSSLLVMKAKGDDTFTSPVQAWTGADLTAPSVFVAAGDVNGDGKADLIVRDALGNFDTAISPPSCDSMSYIGPCAAGDIGGLVLGSLNQALADPGGLANAKLSVGDFDRDGRVDIVALVSGSTSTVFGMRAKADGSGTFTGKSNLWSSSTISQAAQPFVMDVDPDGMADVALVTSGSLDWLRTIERSTTPAQMVLASDFPHVGQDTTPPSVPTGLAGSATAGRVVNLSWNASTDNSGGTVSYRVYRDGNPIGVKQNGLTYVDHPKATYHDYTVKALDVAGNTSAASNKVTIKAFN